jgi:hypothetical protein
LHGLEAAIQDRRSQDGGDRATLRVVAGLIGPAARRIGRP